MTITTLWLKSAGVGIPNQPARSTKGISFSRSENTLRSAGYNIITAKDGGDALEMLMEFETLADQDNASISDFVSAIITDVEMPRMDGMHLVKRLRESKAYRQMPIVMFSSLMSEDNRIKAISLGANDTITKPEIGRLVGMMDKYVFEE